MADTPQQALASAENWITSHWKALTASHAVAVALGWIAHLVTKL